MRAQGYMMDATLEDGLLNAEGRGFLLAGLPFIWDMSDRMEALEEQGGRRARAARRRSIACGEA